MIESVSEHAAPESAPMETAEHANLRGLAITAYVLFLAAWMNGLTAIIGVIIAYANRGASVGTIWRSHFDNLITVFWVMVAGVVVGFLTWPIALGALVAQFLAWPWPPVVALPFVFALVIFPLLLIWYLYRVLRGMIRLFGETPY